MGIRVRGGKSGGMDEINVTPLIDIVLVLLIIFMVLTPMTVNKMASNLPPLEDIPPPPEPPPDQVMVAVYDDGSVALNLAPMTDDELAKAVRRKLFGKEKRTVFVDAHPNANYGRVVRVMDRLRESGADKIGFAEMKEEGPARLLAGQSLTPVAPAVPPAP